MLEEAQKIEALSSNPGISQLRVNTHSRPVGAVTSEDVAYTAGLSRDMSNQSIDLDRSINNETTSFQN